jgi:hypothetical protein
MHEPDPLWDFGPIYQTLHNLKLPAATTTPTQYEDREADDGPEGGVSLGNFNEIWDILGHPRQAADVCVPDLCEFEPCLPEIPARHILDDVADTRAIRWRDEIDGAYLEDSIEPPQLTAAALRTAKRAARRARARERSEQLTASREADTDTATDYESAGEELEALRKSPDRQAVIDRILGRSRPGLYDSPPTSPSPPKQKASLRDIPISNPHLWTPPPTSRSHRPVISTQDGFTPEQRKQSLIKLLRKRYGGQETYLKSPGLLLPQFTTLNTSTIGIHVFIDMSNISIGFHDHLKIARGITRDTFVRRVPMDFHNFSLVLERGRPAAKRVLAGSEKPAVVLEAEALGYETNILERVLKVKELTPRQKKYASRSGGETSGSEKDTGYLNKAAAKRVEQGVDEILHLKILESLIDSSKPSTIVLATGDAAEAEYSGGFLKMVERAMSKGWMVELVSFKLNTSSMYLRSEFRAKWGALFKVIHLDDFAEYLIKEDEVQH